MEIIESILTKNPCYLAGKKIIVKGLMLHSVGCPQPSAEIFIKQWNHAAASRACVHAFIDGNTGRVYQTLPWNHKGWHCGGNGNALYIGVEMCEPSSIRYTGGAGFTCSDRQKAMDVVDCTYRSAVELFATLCRQFGLDPLADGVIISHKEGHDRGLASGHADPDHLWKGLGCSYTMDTFRKAVSEAMRSGAAPTVDERKEEPKVTIQEGGNTMSVQEGSIVRVAANAVYYNGKEMPDWVKADQWSVKSVSGDRAVLGKNVSGSHEINSPVSTQFLTAVSGDGGNLAAPVQQEAPKQTPSASTQPAAQGDMVISDRGMELIARYEGCRLEAYKCPAGVWTIGYGHTAGVKPGDRLPSTEAAKNLLREDLKKYGASVNNCVKNGMISFPLKQCQFDALTSFCYNCGAGNLQKLVGGRDAATVTDKLLAYNKGGGRVLAGLTKRREEERALFLS